MIRRAATCLILALGALTAQNVPFRVQTQVVQVPVSVTDKEGRGVDGLVASDFTLLDQGVPQPVTVDDFSTGLAPISLAILIQTSGISTPALAKIRTIGGMIQPLVTGARGAVAIVTFDSRIRWVQDFTSDDDKIRSAVKSLRPGWDIAGARMLDAVAVVADRLRQRPGRRMLLLISENRDRGSKTTIQQALEAVARQGIEIFGAHYSAYATSLIAKPKDLPNLSGPPEFPDDPTDAPNPPPSLDFMAIFTELARLGKTNAVLALTRATGGMDYPFLRERGIENAIEKLGLEVHSQYILSFQQPKDAEGLRKVEVSVPARPDLRIRSRQTYWAEPPADAQ